MYSVLSFFWIFCHDICVISNNLLKQTHSQTGKIYLCYLYISLVSPVSLSLRWLWHSLIAECTCICAHLIQWFITQKCISAHLFQVAARKIFSPCECLPMLGWCWPIVYDAGPTSAQHLANPSCLLGLRGTQTAGTEITSFWWLHHSLHANCIVVWCASGGHT